MNVRNAKINDVEAINALINSYAEHDMMLFRSIADIYENLQSFFVVESDGKTPGSAEGDIIGCCALQIIWADLAEIKSLAVDKPHTGKGAGKLLIDAAVTQAKQLGLPKIFALTLTPDFFEKNGFTIAEKDTLPMKVWTDCAKCPKQENCDEIAVTKDLI